jgi:RHS repeat-associated protein
LTVGVLAGGGTISANGGNGSSSSYWYLCGGGGGGGRIALYYDTNNTFMGTISVYGGTSHTLGGAGTIFFYDSNMIPFVSVDTSPDEYITSPVDHVDVVFVGPIDSSTFTSEDVQLWGPNGEIEIIDIIFLNYWAGRYTYRITFPLQETGGSYHLSIGPNIIGANGKPLEDGYEVNFTLDTVGPRVTRHSPAGDVAGTAEYIDVWFSEKIPTGSIALSDVPLWGPYGRVIVRDVSEIGINAFRVSFMPQTVFGQYRVSIGPKIRDVAGGFMDQNRNGIRGEEPNDIYQATFNLVDVDLTVSRVAIDGNELWAGEPIKVSWQGSNQSGMPLLGEWTDAVYLSVDERWDIDDQLITKAKHSGGLAQGGTYSQAVVATVPGTLPGDRYIIVRADVHNDEKEGPDEGNNAAATGPLPVLVHELLPDGPAANGLITKEDRADYYRIGLLEGEYLQLALNASEADTAISVFVSFETIPTPLKHDYRSTKTAGQTQKVLVPAGPGGTYYVLVYGREVRESTSYDIAADVSQIIVTDITPTSHGLGSTCMMTLRGGGFDDTTSVQFLGSDSSKWSPREIRVLSSTAMILELDVPTWPVDVYDLVISKAGADPFELEDAFEVTPGVPYLKTRVVVPSELGYHWPGTIWIEYENTGKSSMPSPLLKLHGSDKAILTLDSSLAGQGLWTDTPPSGAIDTIQVMAKGSGATPGILQPGDCGRIPVYYLGLRQPWDFGDRTVEFNLGVLPANETKPINWDALKNNMRPSSVSSDAWDAIWANLTDQMGPTWGDYVRMLCENMNYLYSIGQDVIDVGDLLRFEIDQAAGLSLYQILSSTVDAYSRAPKISLAFRRVYRQPIDSRYELGPLGRGWSHNWDVHVEQLSNGDVIVHSLLRIKRYFKNDGSNLWHGTARGTFTAGSGDHGVLTFSDGKFRLAEKDGTVWQFRIDNLLDYVQDRNGNRVTAGYSAGKLTSITHSNGDQLLFEYNAYGRIARLIDSRGVGPTDDHVITYEYDNSGEHLLSIILPGNRITRYTYDAGSVLPCQHALLSVEHPDGRHDYFVYDNRGRLVETHKNNGAEGVTYSYDSAGNVTVEDATGKQVTISLGLGGRVAKMRNGEGNVLGLVYDDKHQLTQLTGAIGQKYRYSYDEQSNVTEIEDPVHQTTRFGYEPIVNRLASVTDARGNAIRYGHDSSGNLTSIVYADGTYESFTWDAQGNVLTWTNRRGDTVSYTYDEAGRPTSKDYANTGGLIDFEYVYDDAGNLISAIDPCGTTAFAYDRNTNWLTRIDYPSGLFFTFEYDEMGRRTRRTDQDGIVTNYIYDAIGRLNQMTDGNGLLIVDYDYDVAGRLSRKTLGNDVYSTFEYDNAGRLAHLINYAPNDSVLSRFDCTYNASGQRTSMTTLGGTYIYSYDPSGQLTSVTYPDGRVVSYVYDAVGNRVKVIDDSSLTAYTTNTMNQYNSVGGITYTYDPDGNMRTKTDASITTTYVYDVENRLIEVSTPADSWTYTYDALGNRVSSTHNGVVTHYIVDPTGLGNVAAEYDVSGTLVARYEHGFGLLSRIDGDDRHAYYTFDAIGSTSELTDSSGLVANNYRCDPFGNTLTDSETIDNPFKFVGEYGVMREDNGLNFMRERFYSAELGRFVSPDPIGLLGRDLNLYRYVWNNPLNYSDPLGLILKKAWNIFKWTKWAKPWMAPLDDWINPKETGGDRHQAWDKLDPEDRSWYYDDEIPPPSWYEEWKKRMDEEMERFEDIEDFPWPPPTDPADPNLPDPPTKDSGEGNSGVAHMMDPNKKIGPAGIGRAHFVDPDDLLSYRIQFENVADATAPAHMIVVTDKLDGNLDLSTFELTEIAFAGHTTIIPEGLNYYETNIDIVMDNEFVNEAKLRVEIDVSLDTDSRILTCSLMGIDPNTGWLPESIMVGILYPNDDSGRGDGYISFNVKPLPHLQFGTQITNKASIKFDWNDPIDTPVVVNTIGTPGWILGDLTGDGVINFSDLRRLAISWLSDDPFVDIAPQPSGDGIVNFLDFAVMGDNWKK